MGMLKKLFGRKKDAPPPSHAAGPHSQQSDPRSLPGVPGNVPYRPVLASDPTQWMQNQQDQNFSGPSQQQTRSVSSEDLHRDAYAGTPSHGGGVGYRQNGASGGGGAKGGQGHAVLRTEQQPRADDRWRSDQNHGHSTAEMGGRVGPSSSASRQAPLPKASYQEPTSTVVCNIGELDAHSTMVSELKLRANEVIGEKNWRRERTRRESWPPRLSDTSLELRNQIEAKQMESVASGGGGEARLGGGAGGRGGGLQWGGGGGGGGEGEGFGRVPSVQVQALQLEGLEVCSPMPNTSPLSNHAPSSRLSPTTRAPLSSNLAIPDLQLDALDSPAPAKSPPSSHSAYPHPPTDPFGPGAAPLGARGHSGTFISPPPAASDAPPAPDHHDSYQPAFPSSYQHSPPPISDDPYPSSLPLSPPPDPEYDDTIPPTPTPALDPTPPPALASVPDPAPAPTPAPAPEAGAQQASVSEAGAGGEAKLDVATSLMSGTLAKLEKKKKDWEDRFAVLSIKSQVEHAAGAEIDFAYVLELFTNRDAATAETAMDMIHITGSAVKYVQGTVFTIKTTGELNRKGLTHFMSANTTEETKEWLAALELVPEVQVNWVGQDGVALEK